jgi:hypothetical protein
VTERQSAAQFTRRRRECQRRRELDRRWHCHALFAQRVDRAWSEAPDCELTRLLRRQLAGRAWRRLDAGDAEAADLLLELLPTAERVALLDAFFPELA